MVPGSQQKKSSKPRPNLDLAIFHIHLTFVFHWGFLRRMYLIGGIDFHTQNKQKKGYDIYIYSISFKQLTASY